MENTTIDDYLEISDSLGGTYTDFGALIETFVQHMFSGKGYSKPEDWAEVDIKSVQAKCGIVILDDDNSRKNETTLTTANISYSNNTTNHNNNEANTLAIECPVYYISATLEQFLHQENIRYFRYYLGMAIPLITLAIVFNCVAVTAVSRVKQKYLRHYVLTSLSVSDVMLTIALLFKRCGDPDVLGVQRRSSSIITWTTPSSLMISNEIGVNSSSTNNFFEDVFLRSHVTGAWQIGYIMSALGLFCLSVDNVLAIVAPFFYERLMIKPHLPKGSIVVLWLLVITAVTLLHLLNVSDSFFVQMAVCILMLILLVSIFASYVFTCTQAHLHQMRLAEQTGFQYYENNADRNNKSPIRTANNKRRTMTMSEGLELITRTRFRGFLTTALLVLSCLLCWSPLIGYLLNNEDTLSSAHQFFSRYLCVALAFLHLNSVIDPIIYCLRMPDIRKSLFTMLGCRQRGGNLAPTNFVPHNHHHHHRHPTSLNAGRRPSSQNCRGGQEMAPLDPIDEVSSPIDNNNNNNNNRPSVFIFGNRSNGAAAITVRSEETIIYNLNNNRCSLSIENF